MNLNIFDNTTQQYLSGTVIKLLKNHNHVVECSAYSYPAVNLSIYNTNTKKVLSLPNNTISSLSCNSYSCTSNISVSLVLATGQFDNLTSVTCLATSLNSTSYLSLSANLTQNVAVLQASTFFK
jgi:hypothetical protein